MSEKYSLGIDFGTLSGRAVLVSVKDGYEAASATYEYPHKVMDKLLCDNKTRLLPSTALQHPLDYIGVLEHAVPEVIKKSGISPMDIIGIGIDFTSCTMLPVYSDGTPLCLSEKFASVPCSYVRLWKDHSSSEYAKAITELAKKENYPFIDRYGGKISSEWLIPKIMLMLNEAPEVYDEADYIIEACDWIVWQLCGKQARNSCAAGYKALWHKKDGYPPNSFFKLLDPRLDNLLEEKLNCLVLPLGTRAGTLTDKMAEITGLCAGTPVAVGNVDGHATVPAVKITSPGEMLMILGTSSCFMTLDDKEKPVREISGIVEDGMIPGLFGYEAGQACMGDHFDWYIKNILPASYANEAKAAGKTAIQYIFDKASSLKPGESGLIALDWWNGNRALTGGAELSGLIIGMTLSTTPEEILRALVEATAFGARTITDNYRKYGLKIDKIIAAGGIAEKNPFMMQLYADVLDTDIYISGSSQAAALGAAIFGAVAAGADDGGFDTVEEASRHMGKLKEIVYHPDKNNHMIYDVLYKEFTALFDYFGRGKNNIMKTLNSLRQEIKKSNNKKI